MLAIKFTLLILSILIGYFLGYFFTETKYRLGQYRVFQFKAFECRKCLSFHIAWVTATFISLLFNDLIMVAFGIAMAFMLFAGLYLDEKEKTISLENY